MKVLQKSNSILRGLKVLHYNLFSPLNKGKSGVCVGVYVCVRGHTLLPPSPPSSLVPISSPHPSSARCPLTRPESSRVIRHEMKPRHYPSRVPRCVSLLSLTFLHYLAIVPLSVETASIWIQSVSFSSRPSSLCRVQSAPASIIDELGGVGFAFSSPEAIQSVFVCVWRASSSVMLFKDSLNPFSIWFSVM